MRKLIPLIALVACLAPAGSAFAAVDVSVDTNFNELAIQGDGDGNTITVDAIDDDTYQVADPLAGTTFTPGDGCSAAGPNAVLCDRVPDGDFFGIRIFGGGGADTIAVGYAGSHNVIGEDNAEVYGDAGADKIGGTAGHDALSGGEGNDVIDGAAGEDFIAGYDYFLGYDAVDPGSDELYGGPGSDYVSDDDGAAHVGADILDGGSCDSSDDPSCPATPLPDGVDDLDELDYSDEARTAGVTVDLSTTTATSGASGENDTTARFESVFATEFADLLAGTTADVHNEINGYAGDDTINTNRNGPGDYVDCGEGPDFDPSDTDTDTLTRDAGDEHFDCESVTPPAPATPTGLTAVAAGTNIDLNWNDVPNAEYGVFVQVGPDDFELFADQIPVSQYTVTDLLPGTQYCFQVDAAVGDSPFTEYSENSATACATTGGASDGDADDDGVADAADQCPLVAGTVANAGCPEETTLQDIIDEVDDDAAEDGREITKLGIAGITKKGGYQADCTALVAGKCEQTITAPGAAASTVIAKGAKTVTAAGNYKFKVKLTKKGRKRLKKANKKGKKVAATLTVKFTAADGKVAKETEKVTLKPKKKKKKKGKKKK